MPNIQIFWLDVPKGKGGGQETIFEEQYFFRRQYGGISLTTICGNNTSNIPHNDHKCVYCGMGFNDAILKFVEKNKTKRNTKTKYKDWQICELGYCKSLKFRIGNKQRFHWAKYDPKSARFLVYNVHMGRRSMGSLPVSVIPKKFHEKFVTGLAKKS